MHKTQLSFAVCLLGLTLTACNNADTPGKSATVDSGNQILALETSVIDKPTANDKSWKEIVPGYWVKSVDFAGSQKVTTYIDNSSVQALVYERDQYQSEISAAKSKGIYPLSLTGDSYLTYLNNAIQNVNKVNNSISSQYTCGSPSFGVGPYNNGSRVGVVGSVSGSCLNGGRASGYASYNGYTSNIFDANDTQTRT